MIEIKRLMDLKASRDKKEKELTEKERNDELHKLDLSTDINVLSKRKTDLKTVSYMVIISDEYIKKTQTKLYKLYDDISFIEKKKDLIEKNYKLAERRLAVEKKLLNILESSVVYLPVVYRNKVSSLNILVDEIEKQKKHVSEIEDIKNGIYSIVKKIEDERKNVHDQIVYYTDERKEVTSILKNMKLYQPLIETLKEISVYHPFCYNDKIVIWTAAGKTLVETFKAPVQFVLRLYEDLYQGPFPLECENKKPDIPNGYTLRLHKYYYNYSKTPNKIDWYIVDGDKTEDYKEPTPSISSINSSRSE